MKSSKPKRILHVVGAMNRAGTETMLMNLYRNIDRDKLQFDFVSFSPEEAHYDKEIKQLGGNVFILKNPQSVSALYYVIQRNGPYEAVHSHTLFHSGIANVVAKLAGVKVRIAHAHTTMDGKTLSKKLYHLLMRMLILLTSTHLLACSKEAGRYLFREKNLHSPRFSYFPNVIEYQSFLKKPVLEVKKFKLEERLGNARIVGHIGRFIDAKNHNFLIEIFKSLLKIDANLILLLVGDGDLRKTIEMKAEKEGILNRIRFLGIRTDIATMLHSMDVFVFPSKYEGLGLVLIEAQAAGVPCVVSEKIQPEADIGMELISKVSLNDSPEIWAETIVEKMNLDKQSINKIEHCLRKRNFSPTMGVEMLKEIYQIKGGEKNEATTDRFL